MCEPVSMTLLAAGAAGGTSLLGGATVTSALVSAGMAGMTTFSGLSSAEAQSRSGYLAATGSFISAGEMRKQIKQIEDQATVEELQRRQEYDYLTRQNAAAATVTGVSFDSDTFEAIRARNEQNFRVDQQIASVNEANAKGQAAAQGIQHSMAGFAEIVGGEAKRDAAIWDTGFSLLQNFPTAAFGRIGGGGITNPSKSLMAQVQTAVS